MVSRDALNHFLGRVGAPSVMLSTLLLALLTAAPARAGKMTLTVFDASGKKLTAREFLAYIAPRSRQASPTAAESGLYVTDLDDNPADGRPWLVAGSSGVALSWGGTGRVKVSLPWPVQEDGFSTVVIDNGGLGYADGASVFLNEEILDTQYRRFKESLAERATAWEPVYRPSGQSRRMQNTAVDLIAEAKKAQEPFERSRACERALTSLSSAWAKALFEHGQQASNHPKIGPSLRWGLTLDETLAGRVGEYEWIAKALGTSGINWVRVVFRLNPGDFLYANERSFVDYDSIVAELARRKIHVMGSVLDSALWPKGMASAALARRTRNIVLHFQRTVRSWEVASEPNGNWLGGYKSPLPEETVTRAVREAAAEVKRVDKSLETVATLYWWEGTAGDDVHPTFAWLKRNIPKGVFSDIDLVGLSVYPNDNPMGMAFDPVFRQLNRYFPDKRTMLAGYGYVEGSELKGYWWLDPADVDGARKDLIILYSGAACAEPKSLCGGFWWPTLTTMLKLSRDEDGVFKIYKRTLQKLGR